MKFTTIKTITLCAGLAIAASGCTAIDQTRLAAAGSTAMQALTISNDQLAAYVAKSVQQMDAQNQVAPANSPYTQRLNKLTQGLTTTGTIPLNFKVYITNEINAFACPDGSVRVYSGIMDLMTDDELLGIIGHEIGHVAMEHSLNAYKRQLMDEAGRLALGSLNPTVGALSDSMLGEIGLKAISAKYSRSQENQADDFGYEFLKGSGRNPYAMVQAFNKMLQLEQKAVNQANMGTNMANMFRSHPETTERINRMTERCKKDGFIK